MNGQITIEGLGKAYKTYPRKRHKWMELFSLGLVRRHQTHWVLEDISLQINPGDAVGIIGYDAAGKSTLLKIISGVTTQTGGMIEVQGSVASVHDLSVGFLNDLSGRQNITLAGQRMGYTAAEIITAEESIATFSELCELIDQPLQLYSAGMRTRLAFSLATAIRPDILIVDESISISDAYFQHKSFTRLHELKEERVTILFSSHDLNRVHSLCRHVVLLDRGRTCKQGEPFEVSDYYKEMIAQREAMAGIAQQQSAADESTRCCTGEARIDRVGIVNEQGESVRQLMVGRDAVIQVMGHTEAAVDCLVAGLSIRDRFGNIIFGINSWRLGEPLLRLPANTEISFHFQLPLNLGPGEYSLSMALMGSDSHLSDNYDRIDNCLQFSVVNDEQPHNGGICWMPVRVETGRSYPDWDLNNHQFSQYSQFGEDGIIRRIFELVGTENRYCLEFGAYDGLSMSNVARLIREEGWSAGMIEGDPERFQQLRQNYADSPKVRCLQEFVDPDNVERLFEELGCPAEPDFISIDIDGNDYWVWQAIERYRPRVVMIEVNGAYPPPKRWVMSYNPDHQWQGDDYYGASIQSYYELGRRKGYQLVCCEEQGANLFFVREELYEMVGIEDNRPEVLWRPPRYGMPENGWNHPHREGPHEVIPSATSS